MIGLILVLLCFLKKYWNVDISKVNEDEYKNVRFCLLKINSVEAQIDNPNKFGPSKLKSNCEKFKIDFEKAVNSSLDKFSPKEQFSVFDTNLSKEIANQKNAMDMHNLLAILDQ